MRYRLAFLAALLLLALAVGWRLWINGSAPKVQPVSSVVASSPEAQTKSPDSSTTKLHAHNLLLRKGPDFRVYVRWLEGQLVRSKKNVVPAFDDSNSFY